MTNLQSSEEPSRVLVTDAFEEGWDCGVDWANEHAVYRSLRLVQQLHVHGCIDVGVLTKTLDCKASDLFGRDDGICARRVEGFIDGAVAILHQSGL